MYPMKETCSDHIKDFCTSVREDSPFKSTDKRPYKLFTKEDVHITEEHTARHLELIQIRKTNIKIMNYNDPPTRMAPMTRQEMPSVDKDVEGGDGLHLGEKHRTTVMRS